MRRPGSFKPLTRERHATSAISFSWAVGKRKDTLLRYTSKRHTQHEAPLSHPSEGNRQQEPNPTEAKIPEQSEKAHLERPGKLGPPPAAQDSFQTAGVSTCRDPTEVYFVQGSQSVWSHSAFNYTSEAFWTRRVCKHSDFNET